MDTRAPQVDVAAAVSDVHRTLEYRRDVAVTRLLPLGLALLALGLMMFVILDPLPALAFNRDNAESVLAGAVLVLAGTGLSIAALWRRRNHGRPMFVLAPAGIHIRVWPSAFIPWHEVRGIETTTITYHDWFGRRTRDVTFEDVTVILVSRSFYTANIDLGSWFMRGPYWHVFFVPKGDLVQVALHHELTSVAPPDVRLAVEARWHAFRGDPRPRGSVPTTRRARREMPRGFLMGPDPAGISAWDRVKIGVPLAVVVVLLTNVLGLWATESQLASRAAAQAAAEERRRYQEERRRQQEEDRKRQEDADRRRKEFDDTMRRTFGR